MSRNFIRYIRDYNVVYYKMTRARFNRAGKRVPRRKAKKQGPSTKTLAKRVRHIENDLIELKWQNFLFEDQPLVLTGPGRIPYIAPLILTTQGTGEGQVIGNQIRVTSLKIKVDIACRFTSALRPQLVRMIVFWDRQNNGSTTPLIFGADNSQSLLDDVDGNVETFNRPLCQYNHSNMKRYDIVYDKTYVFNPQVVATTAPSTGNVTSYCPLDIQFTKHFKTSKTVKFNPNGITTNALYITFISDQDSLASGPPLLDMTARLFYKDA